MIAPGGGIRAGAAALGAVAALIGATAVAWAGAWTLPQGEGLLIASLYGWFGQGAPWGGNNPAVKQNREGAEAYVEYGLADGLTLFGQTGLERYALSPPSQNVYEGLDYSDVGLRARLWTTGQWVFSGEATVFLPGARDSKQPAQAGNTGGAAEGRLLAGYGFSVGATPAFFDAEFGYRVRTAGPPDEWHADLTLGIKPTPRLMLMLQDFTTVSAAATNRNFPAWRSSILEGSVVIGLDDHWSVQVGLFTSVLAVATNTERGAILSLWRKF